MSTNTVEDRSNEASGYKATLSNPNVSDEAKQNAREKLDNEYDGGDISVPRAAAEADSVNPNQKAGGLKAALNNSNTTEEGRKAAQEKLDNM